MYYVLSLRILPSNKNQPLQCYTVIGKKYAYIFISIAKQLGGAGTIRPVRAVRAQPLGKSPVVL